MNSSRPASYLNPTLRSVTGPSGRSINATKELAEGTVLAVWGGTCYDTAGFFRLPADLRQISVQVEDWLFLVPSVEGPAEWFNHSCDPNSGMLGQIALRAMRPIEAGEEIRYDYAMTDGCPYDEFDCRCGAPNCRRRITGNDWQSPELWDRYDGYFSPYLQRRIQKLRQHQEAPMMAADSLYETMNGGEVRS